MSAPVRDATQPRPTRSDVRIGVGRHLLIAALLLPILLLAQANLPSYLWLHVDRSAREYAEAVLDEAPPNAHVLSNWHWYTPLRYLQLIEGVRPDVQVSYVYPQGATAMPQAWPQRIARELQTSDRPLIVTNYYFTYRDLPYRFEPLGDALLVRPGPSWEAPAHLARVGPAGAGVDFAEQGRDVIRIIGYRVRNEGFVRPGDQVTVDLAWQPLMRLERGYAFFVHLIGVDGVPLGQQDHRHDAAATYEPGEVRIDRYQFPVFLSAAPGTYSLIAGVYVPEDDGSWQRLATGDGQDTTALGTVPIAPALLSPVTGRATYEPFVDGPALVGLDYDDTLPGQRRMYMHWRTSNRPALIQLYAGDQWIAQGWVPAPGEASRPDESSGWAADGLARGGYVTTVLDVPPATSDLRVALAPAEGQGTLPARGAWGISRATPITLPRPRSRQHYLPFGGKMALVDARAPDTWTVGQRERVALRFLGLRPIVLDYVVSVGTQGEIATDAPSDWVPALGAMPTFKWVRGSLVNDVHLIRVQGGSGETELTLGVYDAFTSQALPPLDERIARQGRAGVLLGQIHVP
jgi:hypothetical protein